MSYFTAAAGYSGFLFIILTFILGQVGIILADLWLVKWSSYEQSNLECGKNSTLCGQKRLFTFIPIKIEERINSFVIYTSMIFI